MALTSRDFDAFFRRVIRAVEPYLPDLVIAGGCANALYRYHPQAAATPISKPGTKYLDLTCDPARLERSGRRLLSDLIREADLEAKLIGRMYPPVMKFSVVRVEGGPEVELLCPLVGPPRQAGDAEVQAIALQEGGVTAQPLRYLDLLLFEPWSIDIGRVTGFGDMAGLPPLRIPQPLTYVMQKVLARREPGRPADKLEKDCYYLYETSVVFRDALDAVVAALPALRRSFPEGWFTRFVRDMDRLFETPQSEGSVSAIRVASASVAGLPGAPRVDEVMVHASVGRFISAIKGGPAPPTPEGTRTSHLSRTR